MQIDKVYEPQRFEPHWAQWWIDQGVFQANARRRTPVFSLVIPPPNVTGSLHMGHMLEHTEIDVDRPLASHARRQHAVAARAPITPASRRRWWSSAQARRSKASTAATSAARSSKSASGSGRPNPATPSSGRWSASARAATGSRERFTLDAGLSRAVREVFVRLYEKGLIYRGEYMVNWCPRCHTAHLRSRGGPRGDRRAASGTSAIR